MGHPGHVLEYKRPTYRIFHRCYHYTVRMDIWGDVEDITRSVKVKEYSRSFDLGLPRKLRLVPITVPHMKHTHLIHTRPTSGASSRVYILEEGPKILCLLDLYTLLHKHGLIASIDVGMVSGCWPLAGGCCRKTVSIFQPIFCPIIYMEGLPIDIHIILDITYTYM